MLDRGEDEYAAAAYAVALILSPAPDPSATDGSAGGQAPNQDPDITARRQGHHLANALGYRKEPQRPSMDASAP